MADETAKARYTALKPRREPFIRRARDHAKLTLPGLLPPEGSTYALDLPQPYQGLGARCVVNLASRLMTALLPPGQNFFRLQIPAEALMKAQQESTSADVERGLALTERMIHSEVERRQWRQPTNLTLQHLIVTGNALEQILPDNRVRTYRLDQFVVVRDPMGTVTELVIEENLTPMSLNANLRKLITDEDNATHTVALYTWVKWDGKVWKVHQEINDKIVPGSQGSYKVSPFIPLRWSAVIGEDYGRSKVEEHYADLKAVDGLAKAVLEGAAMASRNITMLRPNAAGGLNLRRKIAQAQNGEMVIGNPEDVAMLQFQNTGGIQFASQELAVLKQDLSAAFLLNSGMRRDAERVTATELRQIAEELEGTLGGTYSTLVQEMMLPRIHRLIFQMQGRNQLPDWPDGMVEPTILTGLEALGREQDVNRVATALQFLQGLPQEATDAVKWNELLGKAFTGLGLSDAVRSDAEVQQIQQQRAAMEAAMGAAPQLAKTAMGQ